jgi:hypothetical protein
MCFFPFNENLIIKVSEVFKVRIQIDESSIIHNTNNDVNKNVDIKFTAHDEFLE